MFDVERYFVARNIAGQITRESVHPHRMLAMLIWAEFLGCAGCRGLVRI